MDNNKPPLPYDLAVLSRRNLTTLSVRLDKETIAEMDLLSEKLNNPSRGALLRHLIVEGLNATWQRLQRYDAAAS